MRKYAPAIINTFNIPRSNYARYANSRWVRTHIAECNEACGNLQGGTRISSSVSCLPVDTVKKEAGPALAAKFHQNENYFFRYQSANRCMSRLPKPPTERINESFLKPTITLGDLTIGCTRGPNGVQMSVNDGKRTDEFHSQATDAAPARDAKIAQFMAAVSAKMPPESANRELASAYVLVRSHHTQAEIAQFEAKVWWKFLPLVVAGFAMDVATGVGLVAGPALALNAHLSPSAHLVLKNQKLQDATPAFQHATSALREKRFAYESLQAAAHDQRLQSELAATSAKHAAAQTAFKNATQALEKPFARVSELKGMNAVHDGAQSAFDAAQRELASSRGAYKQLMETNDAHRAAHAAYNGASQAKQQVDTYLAELQSASSAPNSDTLEAARQTSARLASQLQATRDALRNAPKPSQNDLAGARTALAAAKEKLGGMQHTLDQTPAANPEVLKQAYGAYDAAQAQFTTTQEALRDAPAPTPEATQATQHATDIVNAKIAAAEKMLQNDPTNESAKQAIEGLKAHLVDPRAVAPSREAVDQARDAYHTSTRVWETAHHNYSELKQAVAHAKQAVSDLHDGHSTVGDAVDAKVGLVENVGHALNSTHDAVYGALSRGLDTAAGTLVAARIGSHVTDAIHVIDPTSLAGMVAGVVVQPWFAVVPISLAVSRLILLALKKQQVSTDPMDRAKLVLEQGAITAEDVAKKHWVPMFRRLLGLRFYDDRPLLFRMGHALQRDYLSKTHPMWLGDNISCYKLLGLPGTCNNEFERSISSAYGFTADEIFAMLERFTSRQAKVRENEDLRTRLLRLLALHVVVRRAVTFTGPDVAREALNSVAVEGIRGIATMPADELRNELLYVFSPLLPESPCVVKVPECVQKLQSSKSMTAPRTFDLNAYGMFMMMLYYENVIMRAIVYKKYKTTPRQLIGENGAHLSAIRISQIEHLGGLIRDGKLPQDVGTCF
jgi:hypothetical protein